MQSNSQIDILLQGYSSLKPDENNWQIWPLNWLYPVQPNRLKELPAEVILKIATYLEPDRKKVLRKMYRMEARRRYLQNKNEGFLVELKELEKFALEGAHAYLSLKDFEFIFKTYYPELINFERKLQELQDTVAQRIGMLLKENEGDFSFEQLKSQAAVLNIGCNLNDSLEWFNSELREKIAELAPPTSQSSAGLPDDVLLLLEQIIDLTTKNPTLIDHLEFDIKKFYLTKFIAARNFIMADKFLLAMKKNISKLHKNDIKLILMSGNNKLIQHFYTLIKNNPGAIQQTWKVLSGNLLNIEDIELFLIKENFYLFVSEKEMRKFLLKHKNDVGIEEVFDLYPFTNDNAKIDIAIECGLTQLVKNLIEMNEKPNHIKSYACHRAASLGQQEIFYETVGNPAERFPNNNSLLHIGAQYGQIWLLETVSPDLSMGLTNNLGDSALHCALKNNHVQTAIYLTEKNADLWQKNHDGKTPLDFCEPELKEKLLQLAVKSNQSMLNHLRNTLQTALDQYISTPNSLMHGRKGKHIAISLKGKLAQCNSPLELMLCLTAHLTRDESHHFLFWKRRGGNLGRGSLDTVILNALIENDTTRNILHLPNSLNINNERARLALRECIVRNLFELIPTQRRENTSIATLAM